MSDSVNIHVSSPSSRYYRFQILIANLQKSFREQCIWIDSIVIKALGAWIEIILKMRCISYLFLFYSPYLLPCRQSSVVYFLSF